MPYLNIKQYIKNWRVQERGRGSPKERKI